MAVYCKRVLTLETNCTHASCIGHLDQLAQNSGRVDQCLIGPFRVGFVLQCIGSRLRVVDGGQIFIVHSAVSMKYLHTTWKLFCSMRLTAIGLETFCNIRHISHSGDVGITSALIVKNGSTGFHLFPLNLCFQPTEFQFLDI